MNMLSDYTMKNLTDKELSSYAHQLQKYDMDGYVGMIVTDGLLRKRRALLLYYMKMKGNILFYFKVSDRGEVLESQLEGCQILEGCVPRLDDGINEEYKFRITLIYPRIIEDKLIFTFYIRDRTEATAWEQAINKGRYEYMRKRFSELRNQLQEMTGNDPVEGTYFACKPVLDPGQLEVLRKPGTAPNGPDMPYLELSIACSSLVSISPDSVPSPMIKVSLFDESIGKWIKFCKTETVENCADPQFIHTIRLSEEQANTHSKVRFEVYDVRNKKEGIVSRIGHSDCRLSLLKKGDGLNTLEIKGADEEDNLKGFIYIQTYNSNGDSSRAQLVAKRLTQFMQSSDEHSRRSEEMLNFSKEIQDHSLVNNSITSSYRLPQNDSSEVLRVTEIMSESKQVWDITIGLMQVCMIEETDMLYELEELCGLNQRWQDRMQDLIEEKKSFINHYRSCIDHLSKHEAKQYSFKRSIDKKEVWLECMPTNLHVQTMKINSNALVGDVVKLASQYETITVGCPTAFNLKYKQGGLKKLLQSDSPLFLQTSQEKRVRELLEHFPLLLNNLKKNVYEVLKHGCRKQRTEMKIAMDDLGKWMGSEFYTILATPLIQESLMSLQQAKTAPLSPNKRIQSVVYNNNADEIQNDPLSFGFGDIDGECDTLNLLESDYSLPEMIQRADYHLYELNNKVTDFVNDDYRGRLQQEEWDILMNPSADSLLESARILVSQAKLALLFSIYREYFQLSESGYATGIKGLRHRKDICFIQAAATIAVSFTIHLKSNILDWSFMAQLHNIGFLIHWESLISTIGEENSMLEDIEVTKTEINQSLYFQIISQSDDLYDDKPIIKGKRSRVIIQVPVSQSLFELLPYPLQTGQLIRVNWILFNIGVNEQQSLADRIGDSSIQDRINTSSLNDLHKYFMKYSELFLFATEDLGKSVEDTKKMLDKLHELVFQRKQKHVEILQLSALLCRKMNASRITSCKSGKDRTSMSSTLEQCRILSLSHNLREDIFYKTLDAMRLTGTRIQNAQKNIGERCYAFNKLQRMLLPADYRPPDGSYKKLQT
ncbi:Type II inositol 3,4-bisphosphate 4-phosphatase isoform X2 [Oopsacas minuta]|uniref:phosphatidylinositol-3,4-bisphosphate 4-phosphatase n=1 Tax=Oopsacas minuta TaxID=111878 RepID=A0AAV7K6M0_9METZ|nr:Type II inositol 3,4-bisphosphate 4-phosphatase isoform X2 [Oopsacas minuta]